MQALLPRQTMASLVGAHDQALLLARQGLESLAQAQKIIRTALGETAHVLKKNTLSTWSLDNPRNLAELIAESETHVREGFWDYAQRQTGIRDLMSPVDRDLWDKGLREHKTPPFTLDNLVTTLQALANDADNIFRRAVRACFDHYRPSDFHRRFHKSNKTDRVGPKIIKPGAVGSRYINQYSEGRLADLCKVFHGLDGKAAARRGTPDNLLTAITTALGQGLKECETPYFACRWYKNGNLHIVFRRSDILARFNQIGSGSRPDVGVNSKK